jgi:hypothetical protein
MDISVNHLNNRLALQLPKELPLGLVFVLGRVENLNQWAAQMDNKPVTFDLVEDGYRLRCRLSKRAASEVSLQEGDQVRAGGHLSFDPSRADYFLLARDVEIVAEVDGVAVEPQPRLERSGLASVLADIKKRSEAVQTQQTDLPDWVQRMAPPEVETPSQFDGPADETGSRPAERSTDALIEDRFVDFVAKAMESEEEVELTPDLLDRLQAAPKKPSRPAPGNDPYAVPPDKPTPPPKPTPPKKLQNDSLVNVLTLTLVMLLIVMVAIILLIWLT